MDHKKEGTGHDIQYNQEKHWNHEKHENHVSGADLGAGRRRSAPLPEMKPSSYSLLTGTRKPQGPVKYLGKNNDVTQYMYHDNQAWTTKIASKTTGTE